MLGYHTRKVLSRKKPEPLRQGRGGSEYRNRPERVTTHMEATGGYVKEIGRVLG